VYGTSGRGPGEALAEDAALELDGLYAITKRSAELIGERAGFLTGKRIAALRLASLYGEMERPTGSREQMSLVYRLVQALRKGKSLRLSGPEISRDWMHAGEAAAAVAALLAAPVWNHPVYNLGSGQVLTLADLAEIFQRHGLRVEWCDDSTQADIALHAENGRAALRMERLSADTSFVPADCRQRMEAYVKAILTLLP
jgi:UDP-glucose 4-epimerase